MAVTNQLFSSFFANYEVSKLVLGYPTYHNSIILIFLVIISALSLKKQDSTFLDNTQTNQLKGIAILLVVLGHLWIHVSVRPAVPVLGDYAVSLFLFLSGFGLSRSVDTKGGISKDFLLRRFRRVIIPYWIITVIILATDYILLSRTYSLQNTILTLVGLNFSKEVSHIDYTRWYITLLLTYYVVFFLFAHFISRSKVLFYLWGFTGILCILRMSKLYTLGSFDQIVAFPLGCTVAHAYSLLPTHFSSKRQYVRIFILITLGIFCTTPAFLFKNTEIQLSMKLVKFGLIGINGILCCLLIISIIGVLGHVGFVSRFLVLCGTISYEIFLIHGPLLIKYNPIMKLMSPELISLSFLMLLGVILALSYGFNAILKAFTKGNWFGY